MRCTHSPISGLVPQCTFLVQVYEATLDAPLTGKDAEAAIRRFASGAMTLVGDEHPLLPAKLEMLGEVRARVSICEGRYHQVRAEVGLAKSMGQVMMGRGRRSLQVWAWGRNGGCAPCAGASGFGRNCRTEQCPLSRGGWAERCWLRRECTKKVQTFF